MKNLLTALLKAKIELPDPVKNARNPHFKNQFADLGQVMDCLEEPLARNGLVLTQTLTAADTLVTTLWHAESGESLSSEMKLHMTKMDPQGQGSAITYARRYAAKAMFGMVDVDDDGEANRRPPATPAKQQPKDVVPKNEPIETFSEAMQLIDEANTLTLLTKVGQRIAASGFQEEEAKGLKGAYGAKLKWLQANANRGTA